MQNVSLSKIIPIALPRDFSSIVLVKALGVLHPRDVNFKKLPIDFSYILVDNIKDSLDTGFNVKLCPFASHVSFHPLSRCQ